MKALKPLLLAFSLAAFASAQAADDAKKNDKAAQAKPTMSQTDNKAGAASAGATSGKKMTFSELDRNNDGNLSMTEAAADRNAKADFKKLDKNSDAKLSREEYEARGAAAGGTAAKQPKATDKPAK